MPQRGRLTNRKKKPRSDVAIALSFESPPCLQGAPEFDFRETTTTPPLPFRVLLNTPLVPSLAPFSQCTGTLHHLHPATAQILDDMRFLIGLVLALPEEEEDEEDDHPSGGKDVHKVQSTSAWIYERISNLPPDAPSAAAAAATATNTTTTRQQQHHGGSSESEPEGHLLLRPPSAPSSINQPPGSSSTPGRRASSPGGSSSSSQPPTSPSPSPTLTTTTDGPGPQALAYQAVREAALIYSRAIASRRPLSDPAVCGPEDLLRAWTAVWRVPLRSWRGMLGVFAWVVLGVAPAATSRSGADGGPSPHGRFVKSLLAVGLVQMGLEDWGVAEKGMRGALRLVEWLAGGRGGERGGRGGDEGVDVGMIVVDPAVDPDEKYLAASRR